MSCACAGHLRSPFPLWSVITALASAEASHGVNHSIASIDAQTQSTMIRQMSRGNAARSAAAVDVAGEAEDSAAESGGDGEEAVKPADVGCECLDNESDVDHGKECAGTDDLPEPASEEEVGSRYGKQHKEGVDKDLHFGKGAAEHFRYGDGDTFAWHCHGTATHLEGDSDAHDGASGKLCEKLRGERAVVEHGDKKHVKVDEPSEEESDDELEELHPLEAAP